MTPYEILSQLDDTPESVVATAEDIAVLLSSLPEVSSESDSLHHSSPLTPINPVTDPQVFRDHFRHWGVVIADNIASTQDCLYAAARVRSMLLELSDGAFDLASPSTWNAIPKDELGQPIISRGFLDLYHDDGLARIRQSPALWFAHCLIWGTPYLNVTYDRYGVKLPGTLSLPLPLHVDQNPVRDPMFASTQGLVALVDNPTPTGVFICIPGSPKRFHDWKEDGEDKGDYVPLADPYDSSVRSGSLWSQAMEVPLEQGQAVIWDSRTVHASGIPAEDIAAEPSEPIATNTRLVALISMAAEVSSEAQLIRRQHYNDAAGSNVREARIHASYPPRYENADAANAVRSPEHLTPLGQRLYFGGW